MRLTQLYHLGKTWIANHRMNTTFVGAIVLLAMSVGNSGILLGLKHLGKTQSLELMAYDRAIYLRPDQAPDPRILVVGVTDEYINQTGYINPSDHDLTTVLDNLSLHHPAVIGIDLYRNIPQEGRAAYWLDSQEAALNPEQYPNWQTLLERFQQPHIISITTFASQKNSAIPPPPNVPFPQVGFNDLLIDPDDVVRRSLLMGWSKNPDTGENEAFHFSLPVTLAMKYLAEPPSLSGIVQPIQPKNSEINTDLLQLGKSTFIPLTPDAGGYERNDAGGYQFFLNYRSREVGITSFADNKSNTYAEPSEKSCPKLSEASDDAIGNNRKPSGIEGVSFLDILQNKVPPEKIQCRIILIGSTAATLKDVFSTPYDNRDDSQFPGVFVHAQTTSQILDAALGKRSLIGFWPSWLENIWLFGWTLLGGTIAWRCRQIWTLNMATILMFSGLGLSFYSALLNSVWIPIAAPGLGALLTAAGMVGYRAQQAQQQRNIMQSLLGQSISPEIAKELWRSRDDILKSGRLPGQKLTATILFSDIKGFSTLSEKQPADELLEWLNEYLKEMIHAVVSHGGIVNKFTGDGMLAVFGVPVERQGPEVAEDAQQAVKCALAMRYALSKLNQSWCSKNMSHIQDDIIQMRVGIFTGPITAGSIGSKERLEYGVIGDSVNTASRLESCLKTRHNDDCRILIATETIQHLMSTEAFEGEQFKTLTNLDGAIGYIPFMTRISPLGDEQLPDGDNGDRPFLKIESWGPRILKGKDHKVNVYRVVSALTETEMQADIQSTQSPHTDYSTRQSITKKTPRITEPNSSEVDL
ncbi:MAG: adenylate/guanylate cyclase domain-containing protein [Cyanobacteria bacterium P01_F01_bin.150]